MSRKSIRRSLPPLEAVFPNFKGFTKESNKQRDLLLELRKAARKLKRRKSQPFYSMREIAVFFDAPLRTVAIAYETLESEGLLNRIRSSQTLLVGSDDSTEHLVRGVVGFPVWLFSMVVSPYTRVFHNELEERLRKEGFVADFIFFRTGDDCEPDFAERLLRHNLNFLIWHTPHPLASHVLLAMRDHGVRCITMIPTETPASQFQPNYLMNWLPAYQTMATAWRESGIKHVIIPRPEYFPSQRALKNFIRILNAEGMATELVEARAASLLLDKVRGRTETVVAFLDQQGADKLCNEDPAVIEQILQISRVAFCRGPIRLPYFENRPARADVVGFSPAEMASRIVNDLCQHSNARQDGPHTFLATYHPQESLNATKERL